MERRASTATRTSIPSALPGFGAIFVWVSAAATCTLVLVLARDVLDKAHMALAYIVVVLLASARAGRAVGLMLALLCFLAFNFFLLPPYYTFVIAEPLDWLVLLAFLIVSSVGAQLLHRAQREADRARQRALEVDRLSRLGAETLSVGRAHEAVDAVARVVQAGLPIATCEVYLHSEAGFERVAVSPADALPGRAGNPDLLAYALERDAIVVERVDGTTGIVADRERLPEATAAEAAALAVLVPLRTRHHGEGVLRLIGDPAIVLDAEQARFARALADYAALALERVRLAGDAERADALQEADRLKDAFLASVSHDLRTPLTTIKALAHEIRANGDERITIIEQEADRLNRLVADLLDLSRIRAGGMSIKPEINAVDDLVGAALERVSGLPGAADIEPRLDETGGLLFGRFDLVHALRALVNLLENALKHSRGQPVELEVHRSGDRLVFEVLDRGPGVPQQETDRIFEPFHRGPGESTAGAGLGLAIARRVAEAQDGTLTYRAREGGGSIFTIELPAVDASELPAD